MLSFVAGFTSCSCAGGDRTETAPSSIEIRTRRFQVPSINQLLSHPIVGCRLSTLVATFPPPKAAASRLSALDKIQAVAVERHRKAIEVTRVTRQRGVEWARKGPSPWSRGSCGVGSVFAGLSCRRATSACPPPPPAFPCNLKCSIRAWRLSNFRFLSCLSLLGFFFVLVHSRGVPGIRDFTRLEEDWALRLLRRGLCFRSRLLARAFPRISIRAFPRILVRVPEKPAAFLFAGDCSHQPTKTPPETES